MRSETIFETRSLEVRRHEIHSPEIVLFELIPRGAYRATTLIMPHPLLGCKPYILLSILLTKRGVRVFLPCIELPCIRKEFEKSLRHLLSKINLDLVILHNILPREQIDKPIILLESSREDLIKLCEDNISENCNDPSQCLTALGDDDHSSYVRLRIVHRLKVNLLNVDSVANACETIYSTIQHLIQ